MSWTVVTAEGVTALTLTADPNSACPPLCQILKGLCCSPRCCTASQQLKENQGTAQSLLGTLHIVTGLLNIAFSVVLWVSVRGLSLEMRDSGFPFWFGGMLILIGATCILSERRPSPNRVTLNVTLNIIGFALAVAAIVLYINSVADTWLEWMCDHDYSTETPWQKLFAQKCWEKTQSTEGLLKCIYSLLIILSFMEVFVSISSVVLGIKAFGSSPGRENRSNEDVERCTPLLAEASGDPTP